jgi:hypothetical protein
VEPTKVFSTSARLSAALLIAAATACSSGASGGSDPAQHYRCAGGRTFDVIRSGQIAIVRLGERIYNLQAKPGSVGERYTDRQATLIIDGDFAAFVANDETQLSECRQVD